LKIVCVFFLPAVSFTTYFLIHWIYFLQFQANP